MNTNTVQRRFSQLIVTFSALAAVLLVSVLGILLGYNGRYSAFVRNVATASEFSRDFKENIDLRMYYYVIGSQYSDGLPLEEVRSAQHLAQELLDTTTDKQSRLAIASVLDLCRTLEGQMIAIEATVDYDERELQLENNIYILTALVQEYLANYLYYEAAQLNALRESVAQRVLVQVVAIVLLVVAAMLLFTRRIRKLGRSITRPVEELCGRVEDITGGDLTVREPVDADTRELAFLSGGFEQMVEKLNAQLEENSRKQETLRRTELALLQAQINPHFLYNTMDTIIWLIEAGKNAESVEMVSNLSSFFRHSLSRGEDVITLSEEEQHVLSYLKIQAVRYKDVMEYAVVIDRDCGGALIPKLTLQPLVENALYHGIKLKRGRGFISVQGRRDGADVVLTVTDDGVGMKPERLRELQDAMKREERVGFGLSTVHERIRLQFGEPYGLAINSRENVGTTVTVRLPYETKEGEA